MKNILIIVVLFLSGTAAHAQVSLSAPHVEAILYTGDSSFHKPLIVGLGGSEGGNAWASEHWKGVREEFLRRGYAFLAIGYFNIKGAPAMLDRIDIDQVHAAIAEAARSPQVDKKKIAVIGGSRGGDLALLMASYYPDINCVVAIVPSNAAFPGNTSELTASAWMHDGKELPFVPVSEAAVPALMKHDLRSAFEIMLRDSAAFEKAAIPVERIHGPIFFISATKDEVCPSTPMCERMIVRLKESRFGYYYEHVAIDGSHAAPLQHFDKVFAFLEMHFGAKR